MGSFDVIMEQEEEERFLALGTTEIIFCYIK